MTPTTAIAETINEVDFCGKMATAAGVKMLVMSHLSASGQENDDYARFVTAASKFYSGRIVVAT